MNPQLLFSCLLTTSKILFGFALAALAIATGWFFGDFVLSLQPQSTQKKMREVCDFEFRFIVVFITAILFFTTALAEIGRLDDSVWEWLGCAYVDFLLICVVMGGIYYSNWVVRKHREGATGRIIATKTVEDDF